MPCTTQANLTAIQATRMQDAIERLNRALGDNTATLVIGAGGAIAFRGWNEREGVSDVCAYRKLASSNSANLRRAIMRAEAISGCKLNRGIALRRSHVASAPIGALPEEGEQ